MTKRFLFFTGEGFTISPNDDYLENYQILGFESGEDLEQALEILLKKNKWIVESGFDIEEIEFREIADNFEFSF